MEDLNMIAADCVVISCCCQCLVLQIVVFILLKLPYKLLRKTKQYVKKKLRNQKKEENAIARELSRYSTDGVIKRDSGSFRILFQGISSEECCFGCMKEIENALEDMSGKGEFAFGSFWRGEDLEDSFPTFLVKNLECHDLQYNVVDSLAY
ncbi:uncharacterized protein LOC141677880 [Apium graveolens]|uniref:uncharacterized protein LOC141677880 n=1 Tax=Apium graveolens TaxID=4045 RepID=UPI003D7AB323